MTSRMASLRSSGFWLGLALSCLYFLLVAVFADRKVLWTDEFFTVMIAQQPSLDRIVDALLHGPDGLPPLNHLATAAAIHVFGPSHIVYRLPGAIGVWLALACVYAFIRPRGGIAAAYAAVFSISSMNAFAYAYEARPYGLVMGFCALALLCWQRARSSAHWYWHVGLAVAILGSISSHWYGVLILVPLSIGQLFRWRAVSGFDWWRVALALAAGTIPAVALRPFAAQALSFRGMVPPPDSLGDFVTSVYALTGGALFVFLLLVWVASWVLQDIKGARRDTWPVDEAAAICAVTVLPLVGFALAHFTAGQSLARYLVFVGVGVGLLAGVTVYSLGTVTRSFRVFAVLALVAATGLNITSQKRQLVERSALAEFEGAYWLLGVPLPRLEPLPIVVTDINVFLSLYYYGPESLRERLTYVTGPNAMSSHALAKLARFAPINVESRNAFAAGHTDFYLYEHDSRSPLLASFLAEGALLRDSGVNVTGDIYPRPGYLYLLGQGRQK